MRSAGAITSSSGFQSGSEYSRSQLETSAAQKDSFFARKLEARACQQRLGAEHSLLDCTADRRSCAPLLALGSGQAADSKRAAGAPALARDRSQPAGATHGAGRAFFQAAVTTAEAGGRA